MTARRPPEAAPTAGPRLVGLAPVVAPHTRVLVLGSFPGAASLRLQQYYAHPHNHFWRILQALWPAQPLPGADQYAARCDWLLARGLGLWDLYAACEREGSLDSAIAPESVVVNGIDALLRRHPGLRVVALNGGTAARLFQRHVAPRLDERAATLRVLALPSTSPAHAARSLAQKLAAWRALPEAMGADGCA